VLGSQESLKHCLRRSRKWHSLLEEGRFSLVGKGGASLLSLEGKKTMGYLEGRAVSTEFYGGRSEARGNVLPRGACFFKEGNFFNLWGKFALEEKGILLLPGKGREKRNC